MNVRTKIEQAVKLYFMLVTLITIMLMILGLAFDSERTFSYSVFASPLIYAAIGVLPVFLPTRKKELSVAGIIIRRIIELAIIETITFLLVLSSDNIPSDKKSVIIGIAVGIVVIYILAIATEYLYEKRKSNEMNVLLEDYLLQYGDERL